MPSTAGEYLSSGILRFAQDDKVGKNDIQVAREDRQDARDDRQGQPASGEEKKKGDKDADSRLKKLLPILVVILLLIGLFAALLSSFLFPGSYSGTSTGTEHVVVRASSSVNNSVVPGTYVSVGRMGLRDPSLRSG